MEKGIELKVLGTGKIIKVVNSKETETGLIILGDDGELYTEDQLDIRYILTPEALLYISLQDAGLLKECNFENWNFKKWKKAFDLFMENLVKHNYVSKK